LASFNDTLVTQRKERELKILEAENKKLKATIDELSTKLQEEPKINNQLTLQELKRAVVEKEKVDEECKMLR
jgi:hypothetical protein